ncbi:MAG: peptide ABC transporter permease [Chloroflexi bacterium]|nr:MAG: peptide ABC transporter permease [Chloroflexota bacterium]HDN78953.1 ABC transporter permease [Chloroflexota bacterium]
MAVESARDRALARELALARRGRSPVAEAFRQLLKNKAAVVSGIFIILLILVAIFADNAIIAKPLGWEVKPLLAPKHFAQVSFKQRDLPPGKGGFILGSDYLGRDILSRVIYGTRVSLSVAFVAAGVSLVIGITYGLISGYASAYIDNLMMRFVDFLYGFPLLIFIILMQVYFKALSRRGGSGIAQILINIDKAMGGMFFIFIALGLLNWLGMARIARGQTLSYKEKEFVEAARAVGAGHLRIIFRHLLPNILGPCIVAETLAIPGYIFTEAFLSFIGLGVTPPTPSWGLMISETYQALRAAPHECLIPGAALTLTTLAFNFLGDGLRDAFDPRLRGT